MKRLLPYFSKVPTAEKVYHVFLDCPRGQRIQRVARAAGVGPGGRVYPKCTTCRNWDEQVREERNRVRESLGWDLIPPPDGVEESDPL